MLLVCFARVVRPNGAVHSRTVQSPVLAEIGHSQIQNRPNPTSERFGWVKQAGAILGVFYVIFLPVIRKKPWLKRQINRCSYSSPKMSS